MVSSGYGSIEIAGGDTGAPINLNKRLQVVAPALRAGETRLLDCGCGAGEYVLALTQDYHIDAFGLEYSVDKVRHAHCRHETLRARVHQGTLENMPFADADFDVALLNEVLEHVPNERRVLAEIRRVLKPGGLLIVFSPNRWFPFETHGVVSASSGRRIPPCIPLIPYIPLFIGRRFFQYWARNYWHGELRSLLTTAGFAIESTSYVWQTFENISGSQPAVIRNARPILRWLADVLERTPFLNGFGTSQVLVARNI